MAGWPQHRQRGIEKVFLSAAAVAVFHRRVAAVAAAAAAAGLAIRAKTVFHPSNA